MSQLKAGAGKRQIQIPEGYLPAENFGQVHDPIHARAVMVEQEEQALIVSLEITSLQEDEILAIRQMINEAVGVPVSHIWVCATHSFSSPHLMPDDALKTPELIALKGEYREALRSAAVSAAKDAAAALRPAVMGTQKGICDIVANRDIEFEEGWWVGTQGIGLTDRTVSVIRFADEAGAPIAIISHFAMQSSVMDQSVLSDGRKPVTPDVAGLACAAVEAQLGGEAVAMYLIGAAGDQAPIHKSVNDIYENGEMKHTDMHEEGFAVCSELAQKLADVIVEAVGKVSAVKDAAPISFAKTSITVPAKKMARGLHSLHPTRSYEWNEEGTKETLIEVIRLGDIALVGVQPELNCATATSLIAMSDFDMTLVCTMVNGASKYMADAASYEKVTYEAMNSPFAKGAAEKLVEAGIALLKTL